MEKIKCQTCKEVIDKDHNRRRFCGRCGHLRQLKANREYQKRWRQENPDEERERKKESVVRLLKRNPNYYRQQYEKRKQESDFREKANGWARKYTLRIRKLVIEHYGGKCGCCDVKNYEFLAIDHIDGGGNAHREKMQGKYRGIAEYLYHNKWPEGFRILCHNCNSAIGFYGTCPHQKKKHTA